MGKQLLKSMNKSISKIVLTSILPCITYTSTAIAKKQYGDVYVSSLVNVYDGDTFRANIDHYPSIMGNNIGIRINAIDTPEIRGKCDKEKQLAIKAKLHTIKLLRNANKILLKNIKRGKYFRIVADVYADDINVAGSLYDNGLGYVYYGRTKKIEWCE